MRENPDLDAAFGMKPDNPDDSGIRPGLAGPRDPVLSGFAEFFAPPKPAPKPKRQKPDTVRKPAEPRGTSAAYRWGFQMAGLLTWNGATWSEFEPIARGRWEQQTPGSWPNVKDDVRLGFEEGNADPANKPAPVEAPDPLDPGHDDGFRSKSILIAKYKAARAEAWLFERTRNVLETCGVSPRLADLVEKLTEFRDEAFAGGHGTDRIREAFNIARSQAIGLRETLKALQTSAGEAFGAAGIVQGAIRATDEARFRRLDDEWAARGYKDDSEKGAQVGAA